VTVLQNYLFQINAILFIKESWKKKVTVLTKIWSGTTHFQHW